MLESSDSLIENESLFDDIDFSSVFDDSEDCSSDICNPYISPSNQSSWSHSLQLVSKKRGIGFEELVSLHERITSFVNTADFKNIKEHLRQTMADNSSFHRKHFKEETKDIGHESIFNWMSSIIDSHPDGILRDRSTEILDLGHMKAVKFVMEYSATIIGKSPLLAGFPTTQMLTDHLDPTLYSPEGRFRMRQREVEIVQSGKMPRGHFVFHICLFYDELSQLVQAVHHRSVLESFDDSKFDL